MRVPVHRVVALVSEPVAAFELGVLAEVFGVDRTSQGLPAFDFVVAAERPGSYATTSHFAIDVVHDLTALDTADLIAVPSWTPGRVPSPRIADALHAAMATDRRVLSLCSGAFLLAATGLLNGRRATTHWKDADALAAAYPDVVVDPAVLYVDEGSVITSAGTAAGIDACLHLVRQDHGAAVANALARRMVIAPHRDGGQAQFIETPVQVAHHTDPLRELLPWIQGNLHLKLSVAELARRTHLSTRQFARRFEDLTGTTPQRWLTQQRLMEAERLLEAGEVPIERIAAAVGFSSPAMLRRHFHRRRGVSPAQYRRTFDASRREQPPHLRALAMSHSPATAGGNESLTPSANLSAVAL